MLVKNKWEKYYHLPEIEEIRKKIVDTYTNKLVFLEEPHEYYLDGIQYVCVSDVTHKFKPITGEQMAENCVAKWQREQDPSYKYYGMSKEEILAQWKVKSDNACEFGTNVHAFGESMFYYMTGNPEGILDECKGQFDENGPHPSNPQEEAIVKFWEDLPESFVPVLAETKVFNRNGTQYAGTFDILFYYVYGPESPKNGLVIFDYKGLDVNTPILTKDGWKTMGTVKEGDIVYDGNGEETRIIHTSDIHYKKCYKLYFDNGSSVVADSEHMWLVTVRLPVGYDSSTVFTTEQLFAIVNYKWFESVSIKKWESIALKNDFGFIEANKSFKYIEITKVEECETVPTRCIQVDSPIKTFLFGEQMMETHNTNEDLFKNFRGQTLLEPFDDMLDQNASYYTLQLSLYEIPLNNLGYKVVGRRLIWVRPDGTYEKISIPSVSERLRETLDIPSAEEIIEKGIN